MLFLQYKLHEINPFQPKSAIWHSPVPPLKSSRVPYGTLYLTAFQPIKNALRLLFKVSIVFQPIGIQFTFHLSLLSGVGFIQNFDDIVG